MKRTAFFKFFYCLSAPTYFAEQIGKNARNVLFCRYALYAVSRFFVPRKRDCIICFVLFFRVILHYGIADKCFGTYFIKIVYCQNSYDCFIEKIDFHD